MNADAQTPLLSVRDLKVSFALDEGLVRAVDGTSFDVMPGQVLGIVGESGCGKSVTMKAILQLVELPGRITSGEIRFRRRPPGQEEGGEVVDLAQLPPRGATDARHPRRRDRADPAGTDGRLQPGAHGGRPGHRGHPAAQPPLDRRAQAQPARGARHHGRPVPRRRHLDAGAAGRRLFLAALGRPAPARHDRHGAFLQAAPADRRRADHRDRRHHPGPGAGAAARPAGQVQHRHHLHHP